jgi:hypothetical protein
LEQAHLRRHQEAATRNVERATDKGVLEHIVRFSDPVYEGAWRSWMSDPHGFADCATGQERAALRMGREDARTTLQTSGAVLPSPLDPTIHLSSASVEGSLKSKVTKETTSSNVWRGITSADITASYDAEAAEVSDDTPALTGTTITTRNAQAEAVVTLEAYFDQPEFSSELAICSPIRRTLRRNGDLERGCRIESAGWYLDRHRRRQQ